MKRTARTRTLSLETQTLKALTTTELSKVDGAGLMATQRKDILTCGYLTCSLIGW